MKKFDLIHTTVLIVAVLAGYTALQTRRSAEAKSLLNCYR
jgi:hypothetical protein